MRLRNWEDQRRRGIKYRSDRLISQVLSELLAEAKRLKDAKEEQSTSRESVAIPESEPKKRGRWDDDSDSDEKRKKKKKQKRQKGLHIFSPHYCSGSCQDGCRGPYSDRCSSERGDSAR